MFLLLGPVIFIITILILERITPNYSWKVDYISELSLGRYGWIQKLNFILCGASVTGLCILLAGRSDDLVLRLGWYVGSLLGVPTILAGIWDTDVKKEARTLAGKLHEWTYHVGILGTGLAYFLVGWGYRTTPLISIASWGLAIFDLVWWTYHQKLGIKPGVGQRMVIFSALMWIEVMAVWIMWR